MKIRMAMIGGGTGSFIGPVHRMAATLDGECELVAAALSSDHENAIASGRKIGLDDERIYTSWKDMIEAESRRPDNIKPHFIAVVTPNFLHYSQVIESLKAGFNVLCDKPLCMNVAEAEEISKLVRSTGRLFCLTHNYTGYPMIKLARDLVRRNHIGDIRKVVVEYLQGWLSVDAKGAGNRQAQWRSDPDRAGIAGTMGDIGTHAFNLAEYVSCLRVKEISADITATLFNRKLDDDGNVLLRFENGVKGSLLASQIATGEENNLRIRVYGEKGSLSWEQMNPNDLLVRITGSPYQVYRTATLSGNEGERNMKYTRLPAGHPEGFIEAFANLYRCFAGDIRAVNENMTPENDYPGVAEGLRGMRFLEAVVSSSAANSKWTAV
ncbi:MAG: Gfo/Idh/MocA family oxidoreductase [Bacteroidales bacterium]|jgi:predicted dehydrogenase|nr:Gfo/Idh/MocA family oxidoreductase [Bacteroidales bacterium]